VLLRFLWKTNLVVFPVLGQKEEKVIREEGKTRKTNKKRRKRKLPGG
jgi:hypothetical protein